MKEDKNNQIMRELENENIYEESEGEEEENIDWNENS